MENFGKQKILENRKLKKNIEHFENRMEITIWVK